ncbi:hypothetical protein MCHUDSM44219_01012 [Mycolicibacterium chubuense]|uniref:Uncharacterized protein n=1 Tax=Mycolicibacterium chubuense TaxID=1800 RepID=A0A0J6ZH83_MYCCU|nr:hypothetical protein MCHUDSM44219_01012 [Mycolicibacterium chubuense]SPX99770.1 Uncharacterised protein [Mycolicibacterium chubuense]
MTDGNAAQTSVHADRIEDLSDSEKDKRQADSS